MCGVFGYVGRESDVGAAVLTALKTLEYRGYDSWGLAVATDNGLVVDKAVGRINGCHRDYPLATIGLGHTRWATHGGVSVANSHPHLDCGQRIVVVHNGIIENHLELRAELRASGHQFVSETDSEVAAHLVEAELAAGADFSEAVAHAFDRLLGYNAIVVMDSRDRRFAAAKNVSPLVIGLSDGGTTVASDAIALHDHARELLYLEDDQLAILTDDSVEVMHRSTLQPATPYSVAGGPLGQSAQLGAFPDFLSKEVAEQPEVLRGLLTAASAEVAVLANRIVAAERVVLVGCGTAGNAALAGSYFFSAIAGRDIAAIPASEFLYRSGRIGPETLVIALSQSGETVDVLDAVRHARSRGCEVAAIVNTENSTLDRSVSNSILLRAGIEQCVLATKSYTAMLGALLLVAAGVANASDEAASAVDRAAESIETFLRGDQAENCARIGRQLADFQHAFVIGRGVHYASALEAALKIKEVSYVHAEGFAGGELKHGVIALVEPGTPCIVFIPQDETRVDVLSGAAELRSRGGWIVGIGSRVDPVCDEFIAVDDCGLAMPIAEAVPGQLLAYHAAITLGHDPDRPRNLAKSVTVK